MSYCPLKTWFLDKGSKSAKARESNQMNFNTKAIVVVYICFRFFIIFDFTSKVGVENRHSKSDHFGGIFIKT